MTCDAANKTGSAIGRLPRIMPSVRSPHSATVNFLVSGSKNAEEGGLALAIPPVSHCLALRRDGSQRPVPSPTVNRCGLRTSLHVSQQGAFQNSLSGGGKRSRMNALKGVAHRGTSNS